VPATEMVMAIEVVVLVAAEVVVPVMPLTEHFPAAKVPVPVK